MDKKQELLYDFEQKWGDDLKYVLHEQDVRELFSDISKLMDGTSIKVNKLWEQKMLKKKEVFVEKATVETMIEL